MVSRETLREWRAGFSDAWTVGLGLVPLGLAFGLLITQSGFSWWWAPILSLVIYAGSMEFLAIGMITAGVGIIPAAVTGFMVNFRHIFYGLTFPRHLIRNFWARAYSTYALTDESYAIVSARAAADDGHRMTASRILSIQVVCQLAWVLPGIIGALAGTSLPDTITGMDFALTALFLVLAWESFASHRDVSLPLSAGLFAVAFALLLPDHMLVFALVCYFCLLLVRFLSPRIDALLHTDLDKARR